MPSGNLPVDTGMSVCTVTGAGDDAKHASQKYNKVQATSSIERTRCNRSAQGRACREGSGARGMVVGLAVARNPWLLCTRSVRAGEHRGIGTGAPGWGCCASPATAAPRAADWRLVVAGSMGRGPAGGAEPGPAVVAGADCVVGGRRSSPGPLHAVGRTGPPLGAHCRRWPAPVLVVLVSPLSCTIFSMTPIPMCFSLFFLIFCLSFGGKLKISMR